MKKYVCKIKNQYLNYKNLYYKFYNNNNSKESNLKKYNKIYLSYLLKLINLLSTLIVSILTVIMMLTIIDNNFCKNNFILYISYVFLILLEKSSYILLSNKINSKLIYKLTTNYIRIFNFYKIKIYINKSYTKCILFLSLILSKFFCLIIIEINLSKLIYLENYIITLMYYKSILCFIIFSFLIIDIKNIFYCISVELVPIMLVNLLIKLSNNNNLIISEFILIILNTILIQTMYYFICYIFIYNNKRNYDLTQRIKILNKICNNNNNTGLYKICSGKLNPINKVSQNLLYKINNIIISSNLESKYENKKCKNILISEINLNKKNSSKSINKNQINKLYKLNSFEDNKYNQSNKEKSIMNKLVNLKTGKLLSDYYNNFIHKYKNLKLISNSLIKRKHMSVKSNHKVAFSKKLNSFYFKKKLKKFYSLKNKLLNKQLNLGNFSIILEKNKKFNSNKSESSKAANKKACYISKQQFIINFKLKVFFNLKKNKKLTFILYGSDISKTVDIVKNCCEKNLKENLFAKVAHEIKTPNIVLANINQEIAMFIEKGKVDEAHELSLFSSNFTIYMNYLINDIIQYCSSSCKLKELKPKIYETNLMNVIVKSFNILNCIKHFGTGNKQRINTYYFISNELKNSQLITNYTILMQILCHLLSNAIKFTKSGSITIEAKIKKDKLSLDKSNSFCCTKNNALRNNNNNNYNKQNLLDIDNNLYLNYNSDENINYIKNINKSLNNSSINKNSADLINLTCFNNKKNLDINFNKLLLNKQNNNLTLEHSKSNKINSANKYNDIKFYDVNEVEIIVKDTGLGINNKKVEKLNKAFSSNNNNIKLEYNSALNYNNRCGLGLGLKIVKKLSKSIGANLKFFSEVGIGTEVKISIPYKGSILREYEPDNDDNNIKCIDLLKPNTELNNNKKLASSVKFKNDNKNNNIIHNINNNESSKSLLNTFKVKRFKDIIKSKNHNYLKSNKILNNKKYKDDSNMSDSYLLDNSSNILRYIDYRDNISKPRNIKKKCNFDKKYNYSNNMFLNLMNLKYLSEDNVFSKKDKLFFDIPNNIKKTNSDYKHNNLIKCNSPIIRSCLTTKKILSNEKSKSSASISTKKLEFNNLNYSFDFPFLENNVEMNISKINYNNNDNDNNNKDITNYENKNYFCYSKNNYDNLNSSNNLNYNKIISVDSDLINDSSFNLNQYSKDCIYKESDNDISKSNSESLFDLLLMQKNPNKNSTNIININELKSSNLPLTNNLTIKHNYSSSLNNKRNKSKLN